MNKLPLLPPNIDCESVAILKVLNRASRALGEKTSKETIVVVNNIKALMDKYKATIRSNFSFYSHDLINILFKHPYTKIDFLERELKVHRNTAASYLNDLADKNMLIKLKIGKSNYYINKQLLELLKKR